MSTKSSLRATNAGTASEARALLQIPRPPLERANAAHDAETFLIDEPLDSKSIGRY